MAGSEDKKWKGFSDYQNVASQLHKDINRAVKAYSHIDSRTTQNIGITPQTAVETRSAILGITKRLFYEVKKNAQIDEFVPIYERWAGVEAVRGESGKIKQTDSGGIKTKDDPDNPGYVTLLEQEDFMNGAPPWLGQHIDDLITAGWELGYIRAGVEKPAEPDKDEEQVGAMFE